MFWNLFYRTQKANTYFDNKKITSIFLCVPKNASICCKSLDDNPICGLIYIKVAVGSQGYFLNSK